MGPRLQRENSIQLPTRQHCAHEVVPVPQERHLPDKIKSQPVANVVSGVATVQLGQRLIGGISVARSKTIGGGEAVVPTGSRIDGMAPGVVSAELQAVAQLLFQRDLQAVVTGVRDILPHPQVAVVGIQHSFGVVVVDLATQPSAEGIVYANTLR